VKKLLVLGAGTAGTMMVNKLRKVLPEREWAITIVDEHETHYYQPGFLFIPFGIYGPGDVVKPRRDFIPPGVELIVSKIDVIEPDHKRVKLVGGVALDYDLLIIATGTTPRPEEIEGMTGEGWRESVFDFYTYEGTTALARFLRHWEGGKLVLNVAEMPIKCPVAPLEFLMLADWFFHERGIRDKVEIEYVTPLGGAFTKPRASAVLGDILKRKNVHVTPDFNLASVDGAAKKIASYDERTVDYDLLVTIPTNMGSDLIARSGMGDELNFVPTDKHTLRAKAHEDIFVVGDATDVPASKAGSVAHFEADVLTENIVRVIDGHEPLPTFDGHANCFIESGFGKGILIDFNYDVEPLPGKFPLPGVGPFSLLQESRINHWGKMTFRWVYWNLLLRGAEMPFQSQMAMAGKQV